MSYIRQGVKEAYSSTKKQWKTTYTTFSTNALTNYGLTIATKPVSQVINLTENLKSGNEPINQIQGRTVVTRELKVNIGFKLQSALLETGDTYVNVRAWIIRWKSNGVPTLGDILQFPGVSDTPLSAYNCTSTGNIDELFDSKLITLDIYGNTCQVIQVELGSKELVVPINLSTSTVNVNTNGLFLVLVSSVSDPATVPAADAQTELNFYDT